ncbi:hypothetical protein ACRAWD_21330 [Caulobacter segnis]
MISLVISLTTTPMMCAYLLRPSARTKEGPIARFSSAASRSSIGAYEHSLDWALAAQAAGGADPGRRHRA